MKHDKKHSEIKPIAIVIPAYKERFLKRTLESIAAQSDQRFKLYIGDDASPYNLKRIIDPFKKQIDIYYYRFNINLGKRDLAKHWNRCIKLTKEPLIWLFSDDDIMPPNGIARIISSFEKNKTDYIFFRFPLTIIDENDSPIFSNPPLTKQIITGYEFLLSKMTGTITSAACEYVFSRKLFDKSGGFISFPCAWCSDDATWTVFANLSQGIISLKGETVKWRNATEENISNSTIYNSEKLKAVCLFLTWINKNYPNYYCQKEFIQATKKYIHTILIYSLNKYFTIKNIVELTDTLWNINKRIALYVFLRYIVKTKKNEI